MNLFQRFNDGQLPLSRIEAFSDGVFAIIVTLLVLDLKTPPLQHARNVGELAAALKAQLPELLSWLISFVIVCKFWLNHHYIFDQAKYANYAMVWLNAIFLMFQSFVPFPTAMMGAYPGNALAVSIFGIVMALNTVLFVTLQMYIVHNLLKPELAGANDPYIVQRSVVGPIFYLLGAATAWLYTPAAFVFYMITPLFFITPPASKAR